MISYTRWSLWLTTYLLTVYIWSLLLWFSDWIMWLFFYFFVFYYLGIFMLFLQQIRINHNYRYIPHDDRHYHQCYHGNTYISVSIGRYFVIRGFSKAENVCGCIFLVNGQFWFYSIKKSKRPGDNNNKLNCASND
jgi:hypothetical protein